MPLSVELRNGLLAVNQVLTQAVLLLGFVVLAVVGAGLLPFFAVQIVVGVVLLAAAPLLVSREHLVAPRSGRPRACANSGGWPCQSRLGPCSVSCTCGFS